MKNSKKSKKHSRHAERNSRPSEAPPRDRLTGTDRETLEELLRRLKITDWDFVIVGDGSGSNYNREAGWGSVSIERVTMERLVWSGLMNRGTVNFAEIMAYLQPLNWLSAREADRRSKGKARRQAFRIHIITDSDYCRQTGSSANRMVAKNALLWASFDVLVRQGFLLHWHHLGRDQCGLNTYCDELSKLARKLAKKYNLQERLEAERSADVTQTVYDINPSSQTE